MDGLLNTGPVRQGLLASLLKGESVAPVTANRNMLAQALKARTKPEFQMKEPTLQGILDNAALATSPVPILGDVVGLGADANRFINEPESRTPANFALAALGLIPFVPPLMSAGLGKFAQSQGKTLANLPTGPGRNEAGAIVYHGSPHKFDQFDSSKIGTGEGAQAYGHGLYFAETPDVAKSYVPRDLDYEDRLLKMYQQAERKGNYDAMEVLESAMMHSTPAELMQQYPKQAALVKQIQSIPYNTGSLYKVDLPDEAIAKMLDWDAPLSKQPEVMRMIRNKDFGGASIGFSDLNDTGGNLISKIDRDLGKGKSSDILKTYGIPGIRYLDGGSRGAGQGTSNYVVFPGNEGLLKILSRE